MAEQQKSVLRSIDLRKSYKGRFVVDRVSVSVEQGEIVGLLGPNGAGKTTTFYMVTGMIKPYSGRVLMDDRDVTRMPMYQRARLGIGYLPQEASIFRKLSVEDNIRAILQLMKLTRKARQEKLESLLSEFNIESLRRRKGYMLSGGERRRTEIARALATNPKFILLDEPFAGVDPIAVEDIMNIVKELRARNIGVLITDHNVHETLSIVDRAYLLYEGKVLMEGTSDALARDPEAKKLYLGEKFRLDRY
ncbi:MAG: LPS export ABC transporter ATP-binding protein [Chlorobi bacterium]|nr:LPS export ABC transporter ATP-binding protein [Chlorobiota bacterium]